MGDGNHQICVGNRVKRELDYRCQEGESYNDVLERVLDDGPKTGSFYDGFGRWSDEEADCVSEQREQ